MLALQGFDDLDARKFSLAPVFITDRL